MGVGMGRDRAREVWLARLLYLPLILVTLAILAYPVVESFRLSFYDQRLIATQAEANFVGLGLYLKTFESSEFLKIVQNSAVWVFGNVVLQVVLGLASALVLRERFRVGAILRTLILVPWILPPVAMAVIWRWMLNASVGVLPYLALTVGIVDKPPVTLGSPQLAMPTVICITSWRFFPFLTIVFIGAMQSIPDELYDAAAVDGAGMIRSFFAVTVPAIMPTVGIMTLLTAMSTFNIFPYIWLLTQGGPGYETTTLAVYVYRRGFKEFRLSEAAVVSVVMFVILALTMFIYFRLTKEDWETTE